MKTMKQPVLPQSATSNKLLWQKINSFRLDDPNASFPFSKKLAKENKWDERFTQLAIEEYKKFVYLCCVLPNGASPSHTVDQVWHTHLIYTQNYWEAFCEKTLQKKLHHHPSTGGQKNQQKHDDWYKDTLENYKLHFGKTPPPTIWSQGKIVNKPITKNIFQTIKQHLSLLFLLPLLLIIPGCSGGGFIAFLLVAMLSTAIITSSKKDNKGANSADGSSCSSGGCSGGGSCGSSCGSSGCGGGGCGGCGGS